MEEKKEIKIKLSTVIIIILVLVIIGLFAYIIYNPKVQENVTNNVNNEVIKNEVSENVTENTNENIIDTTNKEEEKEKKEEEKNTEVKGEKLVQFDNRFFELKDIAKEYRECNKIKNYKDFNYDLDGDGIKDKITIRKVEETDEDNNNYEIHVFELNGKRFHEDGDAEQIYIVDLNENDKNIEVVFYSSAPSDDPHYYIYSKKGNKMVQLEFLGGAPLKLDKKGTFVIEGGYDGITDPKIYFDYYTIKDGKIEQKQAKLNKLKNIELTASYLYFSKDFKSLNRFYNEHKEWSEDGLKEFSIEKLNEKITFKILDFDYVTQEWGEDSYKQFRLYVELSDGRKGYLFTIQWAG